MKLKTVRVRMFRNILDSTEVAIQPDVTCLVGKNESGKTAFLHALWRLRPTPTRPSPPFSVPDDYPAWLEKRHRREGQNLEDVHPVEATFDWEDEDRDAVAEVFGANVAKPGAVLTYWRNYANEDGWQHGCDESAAVRDLISAESLPRKLGQHFKRAKSFEELRTLIEHERPEAGAEPDSEQEPDASIESLAARVRDVLGDGDFDSAIWKLVGPRVPTFFYFAEYSKLPYATKVRHVLSARDKELSDGEATARALLRLGGADDDYLLNPDFERRVRELENVANVLTDDVLTYWTQNRDLRVRPEITQTTETKSHGQTAILDELKVRIWDNRHSLSLPFDQHSAGFQWFFSFLAAFSEYDQKTPPVIILLDEPAVGLHAKAQADFLRFIEERLAARSQVLYTTHSPFMVQPAHLERVRMVEDHGKDDGTRVSADVLSTDADTLFPLQGALGYDLAQHLFVGGHNLVVEGTSDYTYLRILSDHLQQAGRTSLNPLWSIIPVGGADAVPTFVALLGHHLDVTVVIDSRREGQQRLGNLAADGYLSKKRLILIGDLLKRRWADIEDLFEVSEYLELYNRAFGATIRAQDLRGGDPIVARIARHIGVERFDHGRPADVLLRQRDVFLSQLSEDTLNRFEALFERINKTL